MSEKVCKMLGIAPYLCEGSREEEVEEGASVKREVDVAIIGNGPAGICLSLLLSGHVPYFTGSHPNPYLTTKLNEQPKRSLLDQDLQYLSDGLEGRSMNPISLLLDTLLQPNSDLGESHPPALRWEHTSSRHISHVVLGSGQPGGSWQQMLPDIKTLSLGSWLELPAYSFQDWENDQLGPQQANLTTAAAQKFLGGRNLERVTLGDVAQYYSDYVSKMGLWENFLNGVTVTRVRHLEPPLRRVRTCSSSSDSSSSSENPASEPSSEEWLYPISAGSVSTNIDLSSTSTLAASPAHNAASDIDQFLVRNEPNPTRASLSYLPSSRETSPPTSCLSDSDDNGVFCCRGKRTRYRWCIRAKETNQTGEEEEIVVRARNVVLACGVGGGPRRLGVPGEDLPFVRHAFWELSSQLSESGSGRSLLVVGAGLSAADAIILALSRGITVVHVFYQDVTSPSLTYHKLSPDIYAEYCYVFDLMQGKALTSQYVPLAKCRVTEFRPGGECVVENEDGHQQTVAVSAAQVLIGSEANLDFLPEGIIEKLGVYPDRPIHAKKNPVDIDPITFECTSVPSLFALGPLTGDNFVRFVLGGSLGVTQCLQQL